MIKHVLVAAMIAASLATVATPAAAAVDVFVQVAPPPPRVERVPPPRRGYVWAPGHWEWSGRHHRWIGGVWIRERPGYRYVPPDWVARNGRWYMERGRWARDRDHDGVRNREDHNRDGDGVRNRVDRRPNNPRRD